MDWKSAIREERAETMSIVALLFSFATIAEVLIGRSKAVRAHMLWILYLAEIVARRLVTGVENPHGDLFLVPFTGSNPEDAQRLARSFRALACELEHQAEQLALACNGGDERRRPRQFDAFLKLELNILLSALQAFTSPPFQAYAARAGPLPRAS